MMGIYKRADHIVSLRTNFGNVEEVGEYCRFSCKLGNTIYRIEARIPLDYPRQRITVKFCDPVSCRYVANDRQLINHPRVLNFQNESNLAQILLSVFKDIEKGGICYCNQSIYQSAGLPPSPFQPPSPSPYTTSGLPPSPFQPPSPSPYTTAGLPPSPFQPHPSPHTQYQPQPSPHISMVSMRSTTTLQHSVSSSIYNTETLSLPQARVTVKQQLEKYFYDYPYDVNNVCNNKDTSALMKIDFYQSPISKLNNADKKTAEYEQKYSAYLNLNKEYVRLNESIEKKKKESEELKQEIKETHEIYDEQELKQKIAERIRYLDGEVGELNNRLRNNYIEYAEYMELYTMYSTERNTLDQCLKYPN